MSCRYVNTLKAEFGRKITAAEANDQFIAIEAAMACLEDLSDKSDTKNEEIHNYGPVNDETILDPAFGNMQLITVEGNVDISFLAPESDDPKIVYLLVSDGGEGSFTMPNGASWATDSNGPGITGIPWNSQGLGGDYGALVVCIHDGVGWLYLVFARNDIDFTAIANVTDLYNWR